MSPWKLKTEGRSRGKTTQLPREFSGSLEGNPPKKSLYLVGIYGWENPIRIPSENTSGKKPWVHRAVRGTPVLVSWSLQIWVWYPSASHGSQNRSQNHLRWETPLPLLSQCEIFARRGPVRDLKKNPFNISGSRIKKEGIECGLYVM